MARHQKVVTAFKGERRRENRCRCDVCNWAPPLELLRGETRMLWRMMHAHHVVPVAAGGADQAGNLVLLCPNCHALAHRLGTLSPTPNYWPEYAWKGPTTPDDLLSELRMLLLNPTQWAERKAGRKQEVENAKRNEFLALQEVEAIARRAKISIVRKSA